MKTRQPSSIALLVAMLAAPLGTAATAAFQDAPAAPANGDGGMNQPMELPPDAPAGDGSGPASGRKADPGDEIGRAHV